MESDEQVAEEVPRTDHVDLSFLDEPATLPTPAIRSDADTLKVYITLLDDAPEAQVFANLTEVTVWLDKYNRWLRKVKQELGK